MAGAGAHLAALVVGGEDAAVVAHEHLRVEVQLADACGAGAFSGGGCGNRRRGWVLPSWPCLWFPQAITYPIRIQNILRTKRRFCVQSLLDARWFTRNQNTFVCDDHSMRMPTSHTLEFDLDSIVLVLCLFGGFGGFPWRFVS